VLLASRETTEGQLQRVRGLNHTMQDRSPIFRDRITNEMPRHFDGVAPNFIVWIGKGEPEHLVKATLANLLGQVLRYILQTWRTRSKEPSMTFWQNRRVRIGSRFDCAAPNNRDR